MLPILWFQSIVIPFYLIPCFRAISAEFISTMENSTSAVKSPEFYGQHSSVEEYIRERICPLQKSSKWAAILILNEKSYNNLLQNYQQCFHLVLRNQIEINFSEIFKFKQLLIIFDLTNISQIDKSTFYNLLTYLDKLYANCENCLQLISVFEFTLSEQIIDLSSKFFTKMKSKYIFLFILQKSTKILNQIHFRPTLNGCQIYPGIFIPKSESDLTRLNPLLHQCNLNQSILSVSVNHAPPFCSLNFGGPNGSVQIESNFTSMEVEFLKLFQEKLNFQIQLVYAQQSWGRLNPQTQRVSGLIEQVHNGTSDLGLCHVLTVLNQHFRLVDYSRFTYMDPITFVSKVPGLKSRTWIIFSPFRKRIWFGIVLSLILLSITIHWMYRRIMRKYRDSIGNSGNYSLIFFRLYAILLGQPTQLRSWSRNNPIRLLFALWLLIALTINHSYSGVFYSMLTVPMFDKPIDTLEDLVALAQSDQLYLLTTGYYARRLMNADPENRLYHLLGKHINRTKSNIYTQMHFMVTELERTSNPNAVLINTRLQLLSSVVNLYGPDRYHIASENINIDFTGVVLPKKSPLLKYINSIIVRAQESGFTKEWRHQTFSQMRSHIHPNLSQIDSIYFSTPSSKPPLYENRDSNRMHNFTFRDLLSIYYIWCLGISLSVLTFCLELTIDRFGSNESIERMNPSQKNPTNAVCNGKSRVSSIRRWKSCECRTRNHKTRKTQKQTKLFHRMSPIDFNIDGTNQFVKPQTCPRQIGRLLIRPERNLSI